MWLDISISEWDKWLLSGCCLRLYSKVPGPNCHLSPEKLQNVRMFSKMIECISKSQLRLLQNFAPLPSPHWQSLSCKICSDAQNWKYWNILPLKSNDKLVAPQGAQRYTTLLLLFCCSYSFCCCWSGRCRAHCTTRTHVSS